MPPWSSKRNALRMALAFGLVGSLAGAKEVELSPIQNFHDRFLSEKSFGTFRSGSELESALRESKKTTLRREDWKRIAESPPKAVPGELAFRMARHAFVLELNPESITDWISKIPQDPTLPWYSAGQYLAGLMDIRAKNFDSATGHFSQALAHAPKNSEISKLSTLALARIAFSQKNLDRAEELYSSIVSRPSFDQTVLYELSWTHFDQGNPDLAFTDLYLLFSLYPDSDELFQTASLLSHIYEKKSSLSEGSDTLEKLALRFTVESESTDRAFRAFRGSEDDLLFELDPALDYRPARAILPTIAKKTLAQDRLVQEHLTRLRELHQIREDLLQEEFFLQKCLALWRSDPEISLDSMTLLSWANDLESQSADRALPTPDTDIDAIKRWQQEIQGRKGELRAVIDSLLGADQYLSNQWMSIGGERAALTLLAKQDLRKQIARALTSLRKAERTTLDLDIALLEKKFYNAKRSWNWLKQQRLSDPSPVIETLDELRTSTLRTSLAQNARHLKNAESLLTSLRKKIDQVDSLYRRSLRSAKSDLRTALPTIQSRIETNLNEYRWSIAESRYKLFKGFQARTSETQKKTSKQIAGQKEAFDRVSQQLFPISTSSTSEDPDAEAFEKAAIEFTRDARTSIEETITELFKKDEPFLQHQNEIQTKDADRLREQAILAFREYTHEGADPEKTPYALFRLAQLYIDQSKGDGNLDPSLTIAALERIRNEYPQYPYMDRTLYLLGAAFGKASRYVEADALFHEVSRRFPDSPVVPDVELRIGEKLFNERKFTTARAHYHKVVEKGDDGLRSKALYKIAWCHYLEQNYGLAIESFGKLLELAESSDPRTREAYALFSQESSEYIAFSLYRIHERQGASEILNRVGDKPYAEPVFRKAAEIFEDRGRTDQADHVYGSLLKRFANSKNAPSYFEKRIQIADLDTNPAVSRTQKINATLALGPNSAWRKTHQEDPDILATADTLVIQWTFDIARSFDQDDKNPRQAATYYQQVIDQSPQSAQAYEATFRIAELSFLGKDYDRATLYYDLTLRNDRFVHHADAAIYNLVACREMQLAERGDLKELVAKDLTLANGSASDLLFAIDHFTQTLPTHPDAPKAAYRAAEIELLLGHPDRAAKRFETIYERYPGTNWSESARLARVQIEVDRKDWIQASKLATKSLQEDSGLSSKTQATLRDMELSSDFMDATRLQEQGKPDQALRAFLDFEKKHPETSLASKAVFNAILIARKSENHEAEDAALTLLLTKYEDSPEAKTAHLERAYLYDSTYQVEAAISEYELALRDQGLSPQQKQVAFRSLSELYELSGEPNQSIEKLTALSREAKEPASMEMLFAASTIAEQHGEKEKSAQILRQILQKGSDPWMRTMASANLSAGAWKNQNPKEGQKYLSQTLKEAKRIPPENAALADPEIANLYFLKSESYRKAFDATRLIAKTPQALSKSFQKKASIMNLQEKAALESLAFPSPTAQIRALSGLDQSYRAFSKEMLELELPASIPLEERKKFRQTMQSMSDPLLEKAAQASAKAKEIMAQTRIADPSLSPLSEKAQNQPAWPVSYLPDLPSTMPYDREDTFPVTERAIEFLIKGNESLTHPWPYENREIAVQFYSKSLLEAPNYLPSLYGMALARLFDPARKEITKMLPLIQKSAPHERWIPLQATYEYLEGHFSKARDLSESMLKEHPETSSMWSLAILADMGQKKFSKSLELAKRWIQLEPKNPTAHRLLAQAHAFMGNTKMSRYILRRAFQTFPDDTRIKSAFAVSLTDPQEKSLQATLLEQALSDGNPENLARWFRLQFDAGNTSIAIDGMKTALRNGGGLHPEIVYNDKLFKETMGSRP